MTVNERESRTYHYNMGYGEMLTYQTQQEHLIAAVSIANKDGVVYARAGLTKVNEQQYLIVASNNIVTVWEESGELQRMRIFPMLRVHTSGAPEMLLTFATLEPHLRVQKESGKDVFSTIANGLVYDGQLQTGVMMGYDRDASFATQILVSPLRVRLEWVSSIKENRIVVESKPGTVEWVYFQRSFDPTPLTDVLTRPVDQDEVWFDELADVILMARYQVIESDL